MSDKNQDVIELIIDGKDEYSDISEGVRQELAELAGQAKASRKELDQLEQSLDMADTYRAQEAEVERLATAQAQAKIEVDKLAKANRAAKGESVELTASLAKSKAELASLRTATNKAQRAFDATKDAMRKYGIELSTVEANQKSYQQSAEKLAKEVTDLSVAQTQLITQAREEVAQSKLQAEAKRQQAQAAAVLAAELKKQKDAEKLAAAEQKASRKEIKLYSREVIDLISQLRNGTVTWEDYKRKVASAAQVSKLSRAEIGKINRALDDQVISARKVVESQRAQAAAAEKVQRATLMYRKELDKLVDAYKQGKLSAEQFEQAELGVRRSLNLSEAQVKKTRAEMGAYGADLKKIKVINQQGRKSTDLLTTATRRLAQAYTVLLAAQKTAQLGTKGYEEYTKTEEAMLGLGKTTDLTASQLVDLTERMEYLSGNVTPTTKTELLGIAEAAGRMGVEGARNIAEFVKSIDALSSASDLVGEDAATAIARILEVTGEAQSNVTGVASSIAALGNEVAATESEIAKFGQRLASDTATMNLASSEVLGMAAGMAAMGVQAEGASTVVGRTFRMIEDAAKSGGEQLDQLSRITGMSGEAIQQAFGEDKVALFGQFIQGLGKMQDGGATLNQILSDMGIKSDENSRILGLLSTKWGDMAGIVATSNEAFEQGNKHFEEMAKQAASLSSGFQRLQNRANSLAGKMGEAFSDDLMMQMEDIARGGDDLDEAFAEMGEELANLVIGFSRLIETVAGLGDALGAIVGSGNAFGSLLDGLMLNIDGLVGGINLLVGGIAELGIAWNKFFGDTDDVEAWTKVQEDAFERASKAVLSYNDRLDRMNGKSSNAFQDLRDAYNQNRQALDKMDEAQRQAVENIINTVGYLEGNDKAYRTLTRSIQRAAEEKRILGEYTKEEKAEIGALVDLYRAQGLAQDEATAAAKKAVEEKRKEVAVTDEQTQTEKISRNQREASISAINEQTTSLAQLNASKKKAAELAKGQTSADLEAEIQLLKLKKAVDDKTEALAKATAGTLDYKIAELELAQALQAQEQSLLKASKAAETVAKSAYQALGKELSSLQNRLITLDGATKNSAEEWTQYREESSRVRSEIQRVRSEISRYKKAQEDKKKTDEEATAEAEKQAHSIESLAKALKENSGNSAEYAAAQTAIQAVMRETGAEIVIAKQALNDLGQAYSIGVITKEEYSNKAKLLKGDIKALSDEFTKYNNVLNENTQKIKENKQNAEDSNKAAQKTTQYTSLQRAANQRLAESYNFSSKSAAELADRQNRLNYEIREYGNVTDKFWKTYARTMQAAALRERQILQETQKTREYSQAIDEQSLSMAELDQAMQWATDSNRRLDQSSLDSLIGNIRQAKQAMLDLKDEAEDTARSIEKELNDALGNYQKSTELQFNERIADLTEQLEQARKVGNNAAVNDYQAALDNLRKLRDIELQRAKDRELEERQSRSSEARQTNDREQSPSTARRTITINMGTDVAEVALVDDASERNLIDVLTKLGRVQK